MTPGPDSPASAVLRTGRYAWALTGIVVVLVLVGLVTARISLVVVPLVLALFPAALLAPLVGWLTRRRVPAAVAALIVLLGALLLLVGGAAALVPAFLAQAPQLSDEASLGAERAREWLPVLPLGPDVSTVPELLRVLGEHLAGGGRVIDRTIGAAVRTVEILAATLLMLVALFFYLKDGSRIMSAIVGLLPVRIRPVTEELSGRVWSTIGCYFRGQLFVALVDAVFIGLGIWLLGVPLVIPLAVVVFLGGLFPIVGAFVSGLLAVLVALADGGLYIGLAALAIVIGVQQLEGNVLEPLIMSRVIRLHPLTIISSISMGGILFGVLGAFLAVPVAASLARVVDYARERSAVAVAGGPPEASSAVPPASGETLRES